LKQKIVLFTIKLAKIIMLLQLSISQCGGRIYSLYVDADRYVPV